MEIELPEACSRCGIVLHVDTRFLNDSGGKIARLYCQNGHSVIIGVRKSASEALDDVSRQRQLDKEELNREQKQEQERRLTASINNTRSKTRSIICDICKKKVFNVGPNQKRHAGACKVKADRLYWAKANAKRAVLMKYKGKGPVVKPSSADSKNKNNSIDDGAIAAG